MSVFSENLKKYRKSKNMTKQQVADRLGINRVTYTAYEIARNEPNLTMVVQFADLFGVTTDSLLKKSP